MKLNLLMYTVTAGVLTYSLMPIIYHDSSDKPIAEPQKKQESGKVLEGEVKSQAEKEISQQRQKLIGEAMSALTETKNALRALEEKKSQDALAALERASGKLNIVLARDPKLALAPIDVVVTTYDVYATLDEITKTRNQATAYLELGEVQVARNLIRDLASEIVISVVSIPLKTYPAAISAVAPLIDKGKIDEAKEAIQAALNTLVVTDNIIPLPLARTDLKLAKAEALAQKAGRSE